MTKVEAKRCLSCRWSWITPEFDHAVEKVTGLVNRCELNQAGSERCNMYEREPGSDDEIE